MEKEFRYLLRSRSGLPYSLRDPMTGADAPGPMRPVIFTEFTKFCNLNISIPEEGNDEIEVILIEKEEELKPKIEEALVEMEEAKQRIQKSKKSIKEEKKKRPVKEKVKLSRPGSLARRVKGE